MRCMSGTSGDVITSHISELLESESRYRAKLLGRRRYSDVQRDDSVDKRVLGGRNTHREG